MYKIPKLYPKRITRRRRKLRSLVSPETPRPEPNRCLHWPIFIVLLLSGVGIAIHYNNIDTSLLWNDFLTTYRNQYNLIVYGEKNYCQPSIDTGKLFSEISNQVLNQETALCSIEQEFRNDSRFTSIAVVGGTGVGKSLFAQALKEHFPWQENAQIYSWSDFFTVNQKKEDVAALLSYLSKCGRNLIIIDSLGLEDLDFVQEYNSYSMEYVKQAKVNLIMVYIFNVVTYTDEQRDQYDDKIRALQKLEDVKIVEFRKLNSDDLKDCIRHEARILNLNLDNDGYEEIFKSINVERSGCKNVHSKVLMYGEMREM